MNAQPTPKWRVAVLAGGPDAERAVSLMSGKEVTQALQSTGEFDAVLHVVDRPGQEEISAIECDVFFPALHGPWGEGGPLQKMLEADGRPFVGSPASAAADAMDKVRTKQIAQANAIATPQWQVLSRAESICSLTPPVVLKPLDDGSSVDVVIARDSEQLTQQAKRLLASRQRLLAERYIPGRELTVGLVHDEVGAVIEIIPTTGFYDYDAKYERDDTRYTINPDLPEGIDERIRRASLDLYRALGCRDLARVDFRLDDVTDPAAPTLWMLEINTMPGFTSHSLVPMGAAAGGVPLPTLCSQLVRRAARRRPAPAQAVQARNPL